MHDLHLANKIYQIVLEQAKNHNFKQVTKIKIELGGVIEHGEKINPYNLRFNIKAFDRGGLLNLAGIEIVRRKGDDYWKLVEITGS